jgi:TolB-like protein
MLSMLAVILVSGCVTLHQGGTPVSFQESWALLPFVNNTETPYAAERAESIAAALLYARGIQRLERSIAETAKNEDQLGTDRGEQRQRAALETARQRKIRYALVGTVNEWRYKVGLDGEPVVGITLELVDLPSGQVVWSGSAGKSGWSRDAVSAVAQQVLDKLMDRIPLVNSVPPQSMPRSNS